MTEREAVSRRVHVAPPFEELNRKCLVPSPRPARRRSREEAANRELNMLLCGSPGWKRKTWRELSSCLEPDGWTRHTETLTLLLILVLTLVPDVMSHSVGTGGRGIISHTCWPSSAADDNLTCNQTHNVMNHALPSYQQLRRR